MARNRTGMLTQFELEIMRVIWREEETTVPELQRALEKAGRPVALPTIRTMLGILEEKGYVTRRTGRRRHAYRAAVSADQAQKGILKDIIERAFDGSALSLVTALVNGEMVSKKELRKVTLLIERHEVRSQSRRGSYPASVCGTGALACADPPEIERTAGGGCATHHKTEALRREKEGGK